jgi:hypothetical protein
LLKIGFLAKSVSQNTVDQRTIASASQLYGLINRSVFRGLEKEELIEAKLQQIARSMIEMSGAQFADPEVEQGEVAQHPVEKFGGKRAIGGGQLAGSQALVQDRVGKFSASAPFRQRRDGNRTRVQRGFTLARPIEW